MFKYARVILMALLAIAIISGCQGPPRPGKSRSSNVKSNLSEKSSVIYLDTKPNYSDAVSSSMQEYCDIYIQLVRQIRRYAAAENIRIVLGSHPSQTNNVLNIIVQEAYTLNGRTHIVSIKGNLHRTTEDGTVITSFQAARKATGVASMGRDMMLNASIGTNIDTVSACSKMTESANTLGKDTAKWLSNPKNNAILGDGNFIY